MKWIVMLAVCATLIAGEKKAPQGRGEDDSVAVSATIVSPEQLKQMFGTGFSGDYTVLDVTVTPRGGKPYDIQLRNFILRSEYTSEHSEPMEAGQIAGAGAIVVTRSYGHRDNVDSALPIVGTKVDVKDEAKGDPALEALKKQILAEKSATVPESGLLFFPVKDKPKNLVLSCITPVSHLRLTFK